jgi:hypothetical protein
MRCGQTFVRKANFSRLAYNLGIVLGLFYGSRDQLLELRRAILNGAKGAEGQKGESANKRNLYGLRESM